VVEALGSCRLHPAFCKGVCCRASKRRANLLNAEARQSTIEARATTAVAIVDHKSRRSSIPGAAFDNLLREPIGGRVSRDSDVEDFPVDVLDYEENVKRVEQEGLHAEEVAGPYVRRMKLQKCSPTRARAAIVACCVHVLGHGSGGQLEPQPCQLSLYSLLVSKSVFHGHSSDEHPKLWGNWTTAGPWPHP
jgi:hypothetical protein